MIVAGIKRATTAKHAAASPDVSSSSPANEVFAFSKMSSTTSDFSLMSSIAKVLMLEMMSSKILLNSLSLVAGARSSEVTHVDLIEEPADDFLNMLRMLSSHVAIIRCRTRGVFMSNAHNSWIYMVHFPKYRGEKFREFRFEVVEVDAHDTSTLLVVARVAGHTSGTRGKSERSAGLGVRVLLLVCLFPLLAMCVDIRVRRTFIQKAGRCAAAVPICGVRVVATWCLCCE